MIPSAYDLRTFYKTLGGRIVRKLIRAQLVKMWPDAKAMRVLGCGYAVPFLKPYMDSERTVAVMFSGQGMHHWPEDGDQKNLTCFAAETDLPFETNSIDRIVLIHSLEFTGLLKPAFEELWRVLKSNGRILIVVPNRMGLWSRAEWTPFGRGAPYSASQVQDFLRENLFIPERSARALFVPPFKSEMLLRSAGFWEKAGALLCPAMGGLIFVEASKQIYAGTGRRVTHESRNLAPKTQDAPEPV